MKYSEVTLTIVLYENFAEFRATVEPYLLLNEARNNLQLSIISYMAGHHREVGAAHYWVLRDYELIVGVALRVGDGRALVFSEMQISWISQLVSEVKSRIPNLSEINGPVDVVEKFATEWGCKTSLIMHLGRV